MGAFQREDGLAVFAQILNLVTSFGLPREGWTGLNVLHQAASRVGALDLGFLPGKDGRDFHRILEGARKGEVKALFLHGVDNFDVRSVVGKDCFIVYQGHHGDAGAHAADVILPGAAYTEKDALYVNTEGRVQMSRKATDPVGEAREDWKIIRALGRHMGVEMDFNDLVQLRAALVRDYPVFGRLDTVTPGPLGKAPANAGKTGDQPFVNLIVNFYQTDPISRASVVMTECASLYNQEQVLEDAAE